MDSYFNLNGKLNSMKQKLASAAKQYIPKDLSKQLQQFTKSSKSKARDAQKAANEDESDSNQID